MGKLKDLPILLGILLLGPIAYLASTGMDGIASPAHALDLLRPVMRGPFGVFGFLFGNEPAVIRRVQGAPFVASIFATTGLAVGLLAGFALAKRRFVWRLFFFLFVVAWVVMGAYWVQLEARLRALPRLNTIQLFRVAGAGNGTVRFEEGSTGIPCDPRPVLQDDEISYVECWNDGPNQSGLRLRPVPGAIQRLNALREREPGARLAIVLDGRYRGTCDLGDRWRGGFFKLWGFPKFRECEACRKALKW